MTRCSQCGWDFTFVQDYRAHYCQQAAAKQTTPQSPKEALPGKFPPRRWISARDCWTGDGRVNVTADAHHSKLKPDEVEYLSLTEHESAMAEAVRKERELRQEIYNNASDALESLFQLDPNNQKRWNFFYTRATAGLRKACKLHEDEAAKGPAPKEEQDR